MLEQRPKAVIWDLDGTLSDDRARAHSVEVAAGQKPDWDGYFDAIEVDPLLAASMEILRVLRAQGLRVAFLTSRPELTRPSLERWLKANGMGHHDALLMRDDGDLRPSDHFKAEALADLRARYELVCAFVDREEVAEVLRCAGIPVFLYGHAEDLAGHTATPEPASEPCPPIDGLP